MEAQGKVTCPSDACQRRRGQAAAPLCKRPEEQGRGRSRKDVARVRSGKHGVGGGRGSAPGKRLGFGQNSRGQVWEWAAVVAVGTNQKHGCKKAWAGVCFGTDFTPLLHATCLTTHVVQVVSHKLPSANSLIRPSHIKCTLLPHDLPHTWYSWSSSSSADTRAVKMESSSSATYCKGANG